MKKKICDECYEQGRMNGELKERKRILELMKKIDNIRIINYSESQTFLLRYLADKIRKEEK